MLSVKRNGPDNNDEFRIAGFAAFADKLIERRNNTCDCCGFRSERYMRLASKTGAYSDMSAQNFDVVCPFCFLPKRLELAKGKAVLVYLPELTQQQLNMIVHTLFLFGYNSVQSSTQYFYSSDILKRLYVRSEPIEAALGDNSHIPENMALALKGLSDGEYAGRTKLLQDVRVLPTKEGFIDEIGYWVENVYYPVLGSNHKAWSALVAEIQKLMPDLTYGD